MTRYILISLIAVFSLTTVQAQNKRRPFRMGVRGGLNVASASGDFSKDLKSRFGFYGGIVAELPIKILYGEHFALQTEINYSKQGFKLSGKDDLPETEYQLDYIQVPILFKAYFIDEFNFHVGPRIGYNFKQSIGRNYYLSQYEDVEKDLAAINNIDVGAVIGAEYKFKNGFFIQARYNFGFTKVIKDLDVHNSVFQFGVGYMF